MKTGTVKTLIATAVVGASLSMLSGSAAAHGSVDFSVSIGVPGVVYGPAYYAPPPQVVYAPRPVYYPPQVYYSPAGYYSGYYASEPWRYRHQRDWRRHEWHERHEGRGWHGDDD